MRTVSRTLRVGLYVGSLLLFLNLASNRFGLRALPQMAAPQLHASAEYAAVLEEFIVSKDGHERLASVQTWANRADGASVMRLGREGDGSRMIFLPSGVRITVYDRTKGKSTEQRRADMPQPARDEQCKSLNGGEVFVGAEKVGSLETFKYRISSSDREMTIWYAPQYNCQTVRRVLEFNDGNRSELRLVSLTPGPAPALFDVPSDYKEGPPSSIDPQLAACVDGTPCAEHRKQLDAAYFRNRVVGQ
jgi:hypothetical protein